MFWHCIDAHNITLQYHLHFEYCSQMQFPHPQFLIDSQLTNMSSQEVTVQKISCPPKSSEDWIINKHQFCNYCKFHWRYMEKVHNNCAPFLCEYCGYSSATHHPDQHLKTQLSMKLFSCNSCGYSTNYKQNLNWHLDQHLKRIHNKTIIKQFACNYCGYSTKYKQNLNRHLKTHNKTMIKPFTYNHVNIQQTISNMEISFWGATRTWQGSFDTNVINIVKFN